VDDPTPEVRIGDRERREVDSRLQQAYADGVLTITEYEERSAQCWAARTRSELDPLIRDLPDPEPQAAPEPAVTLEKQPVEAKPATAPDRRKQLVSGVVALAIAGVAVLLGGRVLGADDAVQLFGSRVVNVAPGDDQVEVGFMFGSVRVVVPADARVLPEGTVLFGSTRCAEACDGSGQRDVVVDASGAFGSVTIQRQGEQVPADDRSFNRDDDSDDEPDDELDEDN
jgi:hypothetical protein